MPPPRAWRPDLYVVARFFEKLGEPEADYSRNQLQLAVRLNYDLYRRYLSFLEGKGLIVVEERGVRLTTAGREAHKELIRWLDGVFGQSEL